jgi:terminase large subunit-like protein
VTLAVKTRQHLKDDLAYYAPRALKIKAKDGRIIPLKFNPAQQYIHDALEKQRQEKGMVRALILKGRQQGTSTYVQARFYHRATHGKGLRAFILTHEDKATKHIFEIADRFHRNCPAPVKPHTGKSNANELSFDLLDSGYSVGTARTKETGRSFTLQFFHGSEVAYWPNASGHFSGVMQAIPDAMGSEVILESTSAGATGTFYALWQQASTGELDYQTIFVPWFWQTEYRRPVPANFCPTSEEESFAAQYGLVMEQVVWRRFKIAELGSVYAFRREYPATAAEAFSIEMPGALWTRKLLADTRVEQAPPLIRTLVAVDPASKSNEKSNETGIIVAGLGANRHAYILSDLSIKALPSVWADRAIKAGMDAYDADRIVYESNQGGDMVATTLRAIRGSVALKEVVASKGKQARAEPVAALWGGPDGTGEQGRCHMVGTHIALEDQLCTWQPQTGDESPDRLDAMVWAIHELLIVGAGGTEWGEYAKSQVIGDLKEASNVARGTVRTRG